MAFSRLLRAVVEMEQERMEQELASMRALLLADVEYAHREALEVEELRRGAERRGDGG
jgi:hypothetical protein